MQYIYIISKILRWVFFLLLYGAIRAFYYRTASSYSRLSTIAVEVSLEELRTEHVSFPAVFPTLLLCRARTNFCHYSNAWQSEL